MEIEKVLVLSTGHMTKETSEYLQLIANTDEYQDGEERFQCRVSEHQYGYMLYLGDLVDLEENLLQVKPEDDASELVPVFRLAIKEGCRYINFDRDGEEVEGLEIFDWYPVCVHEDAERKAQSKD